MDKSVIEPLSANEIDRVVRKDKSFLATYSIVEEKWNYIHTAEDSARWKNITYGRLHNYLASLESVQTNVPLVVQLREKWEEIYSRHKIAADTLIANWKKYLLSNSTDSLVAISYEGVEIERFRNQHKQIDTLLKANIRIAPLKFPIDSIFIVYSFIESDTLNIADTSQSRNALHIKRKITQPHNVKVFPELSGDLKKMLISKETEINFVYTVKDLYSGGKSFNRDSLMSDIPKSVQAYLIAENSSDTLCPVFDQKYYLENIIKELVDNSFVSQSAYIKNNAEDYYKEIDSLVFNFINYNCLK